MNELLSGLDWSSLIYAVLLLLLGVALLIMEFFIVSFGLLSAAALASTLAAIHFAFKLGPAIGWSFVFIAAFAAILIIHWGLRYLRASKLVPKAEVTGDAGYHHVAQRLGIDVGSVGVMVTPAYPSGRARFNGGECDVQAQSRSLEVNTTVIVKRIDGPIVFVAPAP